MATIADIGMVYAFHKDDKGDKKVVPEGETSNSTAASTSTSASASALSCVSVKQRMAVETTKLFGHMSACWVLATGVMTVASAIMIDINKSAALDELELLLNSTTSAKNNSTNNSTTDCKDEQLELTTIDYLNPVVFMCIGFLLAGLGLTIFFFIPISGPFDLVKMKTFMHKKGLDKKIIDRIFPRLEACSPIHVAEDISRILSLSATKVTSNLKNKDISKSFPPTTIIHGSMDKTVPYTLASEFANSLATIGVKTPEVIIYDGWR